MSGVLGFVAYLLLPLIGIGIWRVGAVRRLPLAARLAAAFAAGILITAIVMAAMSLFGIDWNRTKLFLILGLIAAAGMRMARKAARSTDLDARRTTVGAWRDTTPHPPSAPSPLTEGRRDSNWVSREDADREPSSLVRGEGARRADEGLSHAASLGMTAWPILVFALLTGYGVMTARESAGDLHFFWGPKAVRFYRAGGIDAEYLRTPDYQPAHPDYPPLLPLVYAWSHTVSSGPAFSFWAAVAATVLFLFGGVFLIQGASGDRLGALLAAATLSYVYAVGFAAGGADPPLIFFETLALVALVFLEQDRGSDLLAAIGLAGAAWTKIEGATFAIAIVLALLVVRRDWKRAIRISILPIVLLGSWVVFVKAANLLELYRGAAMDLYWNALVGTLKTMARSATYELWGLPWLAPLLLIALGKYRRAAALPLVVAVLTIGVSVFFYIHVPDPTWWILASAPRVLLTPLLALLVAALAAWRPRTI